MIWAERSFRKSGGMVARTGMLWLPLGGVHHGLELGHDEAGVVVGPGVVECLP